VYRVTRPAAFLDRDGTLNRRPPQHDYVRSAADFVWLEGAAEGAARLARSGYALVVVSNQRGVTRGLVAPGALAEIEEGVQAELERRGCRIEAFRYCVHDLDAGCACRKPQPGMLLAAARELDLDLRRSWMIGDSESDVLAGRAAGCRTALVGARAPAAGADIVAGCLFDAAEMITLAAKDAA
jgi:D-glycero-D-manno-heptose 1,7-bisphosphate phosphatase